MGREPRLAPTIRLTGKLHEEGREHVMREEDVGHSLVNEQARGAGR